MFDKKIFFSSGDNSGCYFYRVKVIAEYLQQNYCAYFPLARNELGETFVADPKIMESDIIVLQRHVDPVLIEPLNRLKTMGKKLVYDLDDDLWNIPATNIAASVYNRKMLQDTANIIKLCDAVTVSTDHLRTFLLEKGLHNNIYIVPNMMIDQIFEVPKEEREDHRLRIGWAGSNSHVADFDHRIIQQIRELSRRPDIQVVFMGYLPTSLKTCDIEFHPFVSPEEYYEYFVNLHLDIALAPLDNCFFNKSKSNIKFLEYSALKIPVIASDVKPYSDSIKHCETGLLIRDSKEWKASLDSLIKSKEYRDKISNNAHQFVLENFSYKNAGYKIIETWKEIIKDICK